MSEDTAPTPDSADDQPAENAPRVRRISNPRPKKTVRNTRTAASAKAEPGDAPQDAAESPAAGQTVRSPFPVFDSPDEPATPPEASSEEPKAGADWPDPEPASGGAAQVPENPKRKRRRKKGKGSSPQGAAPAAEETSNSDSAELADPAAPEAAHGAPAPRPKQAPASPQPQPQRVRFDPEALSKLAWKIYLSEVSEEGVALIGDNDAKELSRRCFRLAEIFLEEQARRR